MKKNKFRYILIVLFAILIIVELFNYDYNSGFQWKSTLRFVAPILMIIAMVLSIKDSKKHSENK